MRSKFGLDQRSHARREWDVDVHLGEAEVAAVGTHHPKIVRQGQHCPGTESVADERCRGGNGQREHAGQESLDPADVPLGLITVGHQPVQIQAVGVELAGRRRHQAVGTARDDLVEPGLDFVEKVWREPVFIVA